MDPRFLSTDEVLYIHDRAVEVFGGAAGVRDSNALESAVASPTHSFGGEFLYGSLFAMAAAYWYSLSENQPFVDGNKRTALLVCEAFLNLNGHELTFDDETGAHDVSMRIAKHEISREELERLIELNSRPLQKE